jgi:hypothetical protein
VISRDCPCSDFILRLIIMQPKCGFSGLYFAWSSLDIRPLSLNLRYMTPFGSVR